MSNELLGVIIGGLLAIVGGLIGQVIATRAQRRQQERDMQQRACEALYVELGRLRAEKLVELSLTPDQRLDRRSFLEMEVEAIKVIDALTGPTMRVLDEELRRAMRQFVAFLGPLEQERDYVHVIEVLQERCGGLMRGDRKLTSLDEVFQAIEFVDPESDYNLEGHRDAAEALAEAEQRPGDSRA